MKDSFIKTIIITIVFIVLIVLSFSLSKKQNDEIEEKQITNPLKKVTILDYTVDLKDNQREYSFTTDCSKYEVNNQVINYELNNQNDPVSVSSHFYQNDKELELPDKYMTNFDIKLTIKEVTYSFTVTCSEV